MSNHRHGVFEDFLSSLASFPALALAAPPGESGPCQPHVPSASPMQVLGALTHLRGVSI